MYNDRAIKNKFGEHYVYMNDCGTKVPSSYKKSENQEERTKGGMSSKKKS